MNIDLNKNTTALLVLVQYFIKLHIITLQKTEKVLGNYQRSRHKLHISKNHSKKVFLVANL